jgi:hypothetical protein
MSLFKIKLVLPIAQIKAALPANCRVESVKLSDETVEIIYDDPNERTLFTFPVEKSYEDVMRIGEHRLAAGVISKRLGLDDERVRAWLDLPAMDAELRGKLEQEAREQIEREDAAAPVTAESSVPTEKAVDKPKRKKQS